MKSINRMSGKEKLDLAFRLLREGRVYRNKDYGPNAVYQNNDYGPAVRLGKLHLMCNHLGVLFFKYSTKLPWNLNRMLGRYVHVSHVLYEPGHLSAQDVDPLLHGMDAALEEGSSFMAHIKRVAAEVERWPEWMKGEQDLRDHNS